MKIGKSVKMQHFIGGGFLEGIPTLGHFFPLAGKFVGIIVNAGGTGMESALSTFSLALMMAKAFVIASAGVALMEYQKGNPILEKAPIARKIEDADWAIEMARAVGKRVIDAYHSPGLPILKVMMGIREMPTEVTKEVIWTKEAEEALKNISRLSRPMAKRAIEKHAKEKGVSEITVDLMLEVKKKMGKKNMGY